MFLRKPDKEISGIYLHRWHIIPRNPIFNIYLHKFNSSDPRRGLHDHPWWSLSMLLKGELIEHALNGSKTVTKYIPFFRFARHMHWVELVRGPAWTIFITGPRLRRWGFYSKRNGWIDAESSFHD